MAVTLTYDPVLSRVRVEADGLGASATYAVVDRSTDEITWTAVRGGTHVDVASQELVAPVDDYEFPANVPATYRVRSFDDDDDLQATQTDQVTANIDTVWLKSVIRPFLNRPVRVVGLDSIRRRARMGVFDVVGRSAPVAVTDLRSGREYNLVIRTATRHHAEEFDLILASGDPIFLHVPPDLDHLWLPSGNYAVIGDTEQVRLGLPATATDADFLLPLRETAAPAADVVGVTSNWQSVINAYGSWADLIAAFPTWADVLEFIGSPEDVIVP